MSATLDPRLTHGIGLLAVGAAVIVSWQGVYRGTDRLLTSGRQELKTMRPQLEQAQRLVEEAGGPVAWMSQQQRTLQRLQRRLPPSRELPRLLDAVLGQVAGSHLTLLNVTQGNLEPAKTAQGDPAQLNGLPCLGVPVSLTVQGRYHAVLAYLKALTESTAPGVVTVHDVDYVLDEPQTGILKATVQVMIYVVGT